MCSSPENNPRISKIKIMNIKIQTVNDLVFIISAIMAFPFFKQMDTAKKNRIGLKQFIMMVFSKPLLICSFIGFIISIICFVILIIYLFK